MTLKELELILDRLELVPGCLTNEQRETCKSCASTREALDIVRRDIRLKEMDPRKKDSS